MNNNEERFAYNAFRGLLVVATLFFKVILLSARVNVKKILILFGTRPEVIKLAPVAIELKRRGLKAFLCNTEQQKELSNQTLSFFNLTSDVNLNVMRVNQDLSSLAGILIQKLSDLFDKEEFAATIVQGDTMSAFCGAFVSFLKKIPVIHVEAGLRTGILTEPFPEEALRQMISRISSLNMAPTSKAIENLLNEGVDKASVFLTGNTVIDALLHYLPPSILENSKNKFSSIDTKKGVVLITIHRRENHGERLSNIVEAIKELSLKFNQFNFVLPVHPNPNVKLVIERELKKSENILLTPPLDYPDIVFLMKSSILIMTDSGGIQEEATAFDIPILVLREATERQEGVEAGYSQLVGTKKENIIEIAESFLGGQRMFNGKGSPYGRGDAAKKIVETVITHLDLN